MNIDVDNDQRLTKMLERNYSCLQGRYRLGRFEDRVEYAHWWKPGPLFYELGVAEGEQKAGDIDFNVAVDNFYGLIKYVEGQRPDVAGAQAVLLLKSRSVIYEAFDYTLDAHEDLDAYFDEIARLFEKRSRPEEMERWAAELKQGREFTWPDEQTMIIKDLLIAALLGANYLIRQHSSDSYSRALRLLNKMHRYIVNELPRQHRKPRESYGLLGLTLYLQGRVLMAQGNYSGSRRAFRQSAEAYVNRLRQKEEFLRDKAITDDEFKKKTSVTLRRTALVTAFGDSYLSFISSQINRALESLTVARASLTHNSGLIYLTYVDVWYWACQRAKYSSDEKTIDKVIKGLEHCHGTLCDLARKARPGKSTRYEHRAGVELALALYYKSKLSAHDADELFDRANDLLDSAINYAGVIKFTESDNPLPHSHAGAARLREYKNPHLLGDALIYKSYFLRAHYRSQRKSGQTPEDLADLTLAMEKAQEAVSVSEKQGTDPLKSEAWAALGAVYTDMVEYHQEMKEDFSQDFGRALRALRRALQYAGSNPRLNAASYLRLARLCHLNPGAKIIAYDYFDQWRKLEGQVEHAYLKEMARGLEGADKLGAPYLLVKVDETLEYKKWEEALVAILHDAAMRRFIYDLPDERPDDEDLRLRFKNYLEDELKYSPGKVRGLLNEGGMFEKLKEMMVTLLPQ